jgi:pantothenate kinase
LTAEDVLRLQGLNEPIAIDEVVQIYLPLARLLSLYVEAERVLYRARAAAAQGRPGDYRRISPSATDPRRARPDGEKGLPGEL